MVFISSRKLFSLLRHWILCRILHFFSTDSRFKGSDQKRNFSKHVLKLKEKPVSTSRPSLFFIILSINGDLVQRKKIKLTFSWSLLKYLIFKIFLHVLAVLGYWQKLRRVMGLVSSVDFLHTFFKKIFSLNSLSNDQVSWFGGCHLKSKELQLESEGSRFKPY